MLKLLTVQDLDGKVLQERAMAYSGVSNRTLYSEVSLDQLGISYDQEESESAENAPFP